MKDDETKPQEDLPAEYVRAIPARDYRKMLEVIQWFESTIKPLKCQICERLQNDYAIDKNTD